ncbi:hypothetical protein [Deinococcus navajonensis]|uniref:Uncharacterized protein n=1 Tax=Deinococcus navajonensis TaxID=309884 RepID=A0ABV8XS44_9DEIO
MEQAVFLAPRPISLSRLLLDWHAGVAHRHRIVEALTGLSSGSTVREWLRELVGTTSGPCANPAGPTGTEAWRQELLACQARTWPAPEAAGLLVGPSALLLTDGDRAVILDDAGTRRVPPGVARSLLLLAQTVVMADDALDAQEIDRMRRSRVQASSSSLSEITPVH